MSDGEVEREFEPEQQNGVYLFKIENVYDGYLVKSLNDEYALVQKVNINSHHVSVSDELEIECDGFSFTDRRTFNIRSVDTEVEQ